MRATVTLVLPLMVVEHLPENEVRTFWIGGYRLIVFGMGVLDVGSETERAGNDRPSQMDVEAKPALAPCNIEI